MTFARLDKDGNITRHRVVCDCSDDMPLVEQHHKEEVDINEIVRRHANGEDLLNRTAKLQTAEYRFDDVTGNDFQEAMQKITKAQSTFEAMPSKLRQKFNNNPAEFLDFVQNPENQDQLIDMGLATKIPEQQPVQVVVTQPITPQAEGNEATEGTGGS